MLPSEGSNESPPVTDMSSLDDDTSNKAVPGTPQSAYIHCRPCFSQNLVAKLSRSSLGQDRSSTQSSRTDQLASTDSQDVLLSFPPRRAQPHSGDSGAHQHYPSYNQAHTSGSNTASSHHQYLSNLQSIPFTDPFTAQHVQSRATPQRHDRNINKNQTSPVLPLEWDRGSAPWSPIKHIPPEDRKRSLVDENPTQNWTGFADRPNLQIDSDDEEAEGQGRRKIKRIKKGAVGPECREPNKYEKDRGNGRGDREEEGGMAGVV